MSISIENRIECIVAQLNDDGLGAAEKPAR